MEPEIYDYLVMQLLNKKVVAEFSDETLWSLFPVPTASYVRQSDNDFIFEIANGEQQKLDAIHATVWSQCDGETSLQQIASRINDRFQLRHRGEDTVRNYTPLLVLQGLVIIEGVAVVGTD